MKNEPTYSLLNAINYPKDLRQLSVYLLFCMETRKYLYSPDQNMEYGQIQSRYSR